MILILKPTFFIILTHNIYLNRCHLSVLLYYYEKNVALCFILPSFLHYSFLFFILLLFCFFIIRLCFYRLCQQGKNLRITHGIRVSPLRMLLVGIVPKEKGSRLFNLVYLIIFLQNFQEILSSLFNPVNLKILDLYSEMR